MRGKQANMVERRRAVEEAESELVALRRKNVQLVEENRALKADAGRAQKSHAQEVRRLRAERDHDAAPKVAVLERQLREERTALQRMTATAAAAVECRKRGAQRTHRHFMSEHGLTWVEAAEMVVKLFFVENEDDALLFGVIGNEDIAAAQRAAKAVRTSLDPDRDRQEAEQLDRLQRVRGARRPR